MRKRYYTKPELVPAKYSQEDFGITSEEARAQLNKMYYSTEKLIKDKILEDDELITWPPLVDPFQAFVMVNHRLPTTNEFVDAYMDEYFIAQPGDIIRHENNYGKIMTFKRWALISKIIRTYASLIREFIFFLDLDRYKVFHAIKYKIDQDKRGVDLTVICREGDPPINVALHVDTPNARKNAKRKREHSELKPHIYLLTDYRLAKDKDILGNVSLYSGTHAKRLKQAIIEYIDTNAQNPFIVDDKGIIKL